MPLETRNRLAHSIPPEHLSDDPLDEQGSQITLQVGERADAADDEHDGERTSALHLVHLRELSEPDGRERDHGHVDTLGVVPASVAEPPEPGRADGHQRHEDEERHDQPTQRRVHCAILRAFAGRALCLRQDVRERRGQVGKHEGEAARREALGNRALPGEHRLRSRAERELHRELGHSEDRGPPEGAP